MKFKSSGSLLLALALVLALSGSARSDGKHGDDRDSDRDASLKLLGTIAIPGNPIASTDIVWVDQASEMLYLADRNNGPTTPTPPNGAPTHGAIDVIDAENDVYVGRITTGTVGGSAVYFTGAATTNFRLGGPNGVVSTDDKKIWVGDGDTTVKVADVDPDSPTYLQIIASIPTGNLMSVSMCGATCLRDDELAYDPADHIIAVATDAPVSIPPYLTFINSKPPYNVLGQMNFALQGLATGNGLEQPLWDPKIHRLLQTLPLTSGDGTGEIAVINPVTRSIDRLIPLSGFHCSPSGEALGPDQHVVIACAIPGASAPSPSSFPLVIDVQTGDEIGPGINEVGGGDEVNYNPGDRRFIVSANVDGVTTDPLVLGVINAENGHWLENLPPATPPSTGGLATTGRAGNLAALGENNHVFVKVTAARAPARDICGTFGGVDYGCIAVFGPKGEDPDNSDRDHSEEDH